MQGKVIIATHREAKFPTDPAYLPVAIGEVGRKLPYTQDNTGRHIADRNSRYSELTALYWAWKQLASSNDWLGLVHYRRYFATTKTTRSKRTKANPSQHSLDAAILSSEEINQLLKQYDAIVASPTRYYIETLASHYYHTHDAHHLQVMQQVIADLAPEYLTTYEQTLRQRQGHMYNMLIMPTDTLDAYCRWLFPILDELDQRIQATIPPGHTQSAYDQRYIGRLSELLMNVWLNHHQLEVYPCPMIYTEPVNWPRKISRFLQAKFFKRPYSDSF